MKNGRQKIGFTCAYTPLPLLDAAGFVPHRILPLGDAPDQAGSLLHDNLCPHVKRVLDRMLTGELDRLAGLVIMNSCDAMRRLADAWTSARPGERVVLVDLPYTDDERSRSYFRGELERLKEVLGQWSGRPVPSEGIHLGIRRYNQLADRLEHLDARAARAALAGGRKKLQWWHNRSVTEAAEDLLAELEIVLDETEIPRGTGSRVPVLLFGNVLADPDAFDLLESAGVHVVAEDLCTGSRQLTRVETDGDSDPLDRLASGLLSRPACARTLPGGRPAALAEQVLARARETGARGIVAHVIKFCDPYLARLPTLLRLLREEGLPVLVLEGDCTLRSLGQHRTRIEAFVEMLGGSPS